MSFNQRWGESDTEYQRRLEKQQLEETKRSNKLMEQQNKLLQQQTLADGQSRSTRNHEGFPPEETEFHAVPRYTNADVQKGRRAIEQHRAKAAEARKSRNYKLYQAHKRSERSEKQRIKGYQRQIRRRKQNALQEQFIRLSLYIVYVLAWLAATLILAEEKPTYAFVPSIIIAVLSGIFLYRFRLLSLPLSAIGLVIALAASFFGGPFVHFILAIALCYIYATRNRTHRRNPQ